MTHESIIGLGELVKTHEPAKRQSKEACLTNLWWQGFLCMCYVWVCVCVCVLDLFALETR